MHMKIPIGTCDTAVQECGCAWCLNLVTVPIHVEPILETPWIFPYPWQTLQGARMEYPETVGPSGVILEDE